VSPVTGQMYALVESEHSQVKNKKFQWVDDFQAPIVGSKSPEIAEPPYRNFYEDMKAMGVFIPYCLRQAELCALVVALRANGFPIPTSGLY
jgi:hypothetical protein